MIILIACRRYLIPYILSNRSYSFSKYQASQSIQCFSRTFYTRQIHQVMQINWTITLCPSYWRICGIHDPVYRALYFDRKKISCVYILMGFG